MNPSKVLQKPISDVQAAAEHFRLKLELSTDSADVYHDLVNQIDGFVVVDTRSLEQYTKAHIPTAIRFPDESVMDRLDPSMTYVVYCDGIGCNGSTKGALKFSALGFKAKELMGGIDWWEKRDGYPVVAGEAPGSLPGLELTASKVNCSC
jgi:rhodanese-related sulfurtransferase